jgi:hypothetical protein
MAPTPLAAARILYRKLTKQKIDPDGLHQFAAFMGVNKEFFDKVNEVFSSVELDSLQVEADIQARAERKKAVSKRARERAKKKKQLEKEINDRRENTAVHP